MAFLIYSFALALPTVLALSSITEPNCEELIKPQVLDGNYSSIMGKWILAGEVTESILAMLTHMLDTYWMELSPGTNNETILVRQTFSMEKICTAGSWEFPLANNTVNNGETVRFYLLPSCSNCFTGFYTLQQQNDSHRILLLFSRERKVSKEAKALFRKQAKCLRLPKPSFYNTVIELCQDGTNEIPDEEY